MSMYYLVDDHGEPLGKFSDRQEAEMAHGQLTARDPAAAYECTIIELDGTPPNQQGSTGAHRGTRDRFLGLIRQGGRRAERAGRAVASEAYGLKQKAMHPREEENPQPDATLTAKVETVIFLDAELPRGQINVNAESGIVYLRGEVERPELIESLEKAARKVQGVRDVENLLHMRGLPAPTEEPETH